VAEVCSQYNLCAAIGLERHPGHGQLQLIEVDHPMDRLAINLTGPHPPTARQNQNVLTCVNYFSRYLIMAAPDGRPKQQSVAPPAGSKTGTPAATLDSLSVGDLRRLTEAKTAVTALKSSVANSASASSADEAEPVYQPVCDDEFEPVAKAGSAQLTSEPVVVPPVGAMTTIVSPTAAAQNLCYVG
jgi:hypothetical protein